jgi:uncharacterized protein
LASFNLQGNQIIPYIPYASDDIQLQQLVEGVINRQAKSIIIDPFANSFNYDDSSVEGHQTDTVTPPMQKSVFESKYEIDSLAIFLKITYYYLQVVPDRTSNVVTGTWLRAAATLLDTIETMQNDMGALASVPYSFQRLTQQASDTLGMNGRGPPARRNGFSRSLFRPSDDAVVLPFNVPGNAMACTELKHLEEILSFDHVRHAAHPDLLKRSRSISDEICNALATTVKLGSLTGSSLPYEMDGYGSSLFMDDANVPSLLSLPTLGYMAKTNPVYETTRNFVLSERNPFFFSGKSGEGVGGPHIGYNMTWPMGIIIRAMTSIDDDEIMHCVSMLLSSSAGTGFLHESFDVEDVSHYTRSWFAWVNGLFGELILQLIVEKPSLVLKQSTIEAMQAIVRTPVSVLAQKNPILS